MTKTVAPGRNGGDEKSNARNWQRDKKAAPGKADARAFGQDILNGEGIKPARGLTTKGKKVAGTDSGESNDVRGALTHRTTTDPYRKETASLKGGTTFGLTSAAYRDAGHEARQPGEIPGGMVYGAMTMSDGAERTITGTSIFDPVLCEIAYRWFCPPGGIVLDPFAGGSVRGIVASMLGRRYVGVDLRPEQVAANRAQASTICEGQAFKPVWIEGDSRLVVPDLLDVEADIVFSCPPYGDLEIYSELEGDISNMRHEDFLVAYRQIIAASVERLKRDRFAIFVVGDYRDPDGFYRNFPGETIAAFLAAGAKLYNEAILVTAAGSLPIRAGKQFSTTRKLGKTHQNILVFCKGDPRKATEAIGDVEFGEIGAEDSAPEESGADAAPAGDQQWGEKL